MIEIGCGEVRKASSPYYLRVEDKMHVFEIMKSQLHTRIQHAKDELEAVTFGIAICGMSVTCYRMRVDRSNGVYLYWQDESFTLPITYKTYGHNMDIALEAVLQFQKRMLQSLSQTKADTHEDIIRHLYKPLIPFF